MNKKSLLVFLGVLLTPVLCVAENLHDEVQSLLEKMYKAAHTMNYDGTFVYGQGDQLSSMRIIHSVSDNQEQERLVSMDGSGREVIRKGDTVTCYLPDTESVVVEKSRQDTKFPPVFPMSIDRIKSNYVFKIADGQRVAGRNTVKIMITPRDNMRYGHYLWVDNKTGLLLKTYLLNENSKKLEQFMFTRIQFLDKVTPSLLKPSLSTEGYKWRELDGKANTVNQPKPSEWTVDKLPDGFKPDMQRKHMMPENSMPVEHMVFSDGLSSISVFIEKAMKDRNDNLVGSSHMGAVHAHGWKLDDYYITAVGEAPLDAVKMISRSVRKK